MFLKILYNLGPALISPQCLRCGSYRVEAHFFCAGCIDFVLEHVNLQHEQLAENLDAISLFSWPPGKSDSLSELVYLLKKAPSARAWKWYAQIFLNELLQQEDELLNLQSTLFIPIPGSKKNSWHTQHFTDVLCKMTQAQQLRVLKKVIVSKDKTEDQKTLNKNKRQAVQMHFIEEFTDKIQAYSSIVLLDDVLTTGATATACYKTLKPYLAVGTHVTVLSLFRRELLEKSSC